MPYQPPAKILITSDDSIIEYQRTLPKKKKDVEEERVYVYKFIKSLTKENVEFEISHSRLEKQLTNYFKII